MARRTLSYHARRVLGSLCRIERGKSVPLDRVDSRIASGLMRQNFAYSAGFGLYAATEPGRAWWEAFRKGEQPANPNRGWAKRDVCGLFASKAREAVDEWDGQDNGDLIELLADKLGISLATLVAQGIERLNMDGLAARENSPPDEPENPFAEYRRIHGDEATMKMIEEGIDNAMNAIDWPVESAEDRPATE